MKSFEIKGLGLEEIQDKEIAEINGGTVLAAITIALALIPILMDAYDHREDIARGFHEGYASTQ